MDRNTNFSSEANQLIKSLSARRAWIEIKVRYPWTPLTSVALRKESVDRNWAALFLRFGRMMSLSARRAWIEIHTPRSGVPWQAVALRKESVDRNIPFDVAMVPPKRRSPQGERG